VYVGLGWEFDGQTWLHSAVELGEFMHPTTFANRIVSSTLGELWAFDRRPPRRGQRTRLGDQHDRPRHVVVHRQGTA
jgi:hypothetical protein